MDKYQMGEWGWMIIFALIFGIFQKISDAQNEHGLRINPAFYYLTSTITGISGILLASLSWSIHVFLIGLSLYWIYKKKIDYKNHQLSLVVFVLGSIFILLQVSFFPFLLSIFILLTYVFFDLIRLISKKSPKLAIFHHTSLYLVLVPLLFSYLFSDLMIITSSLISITSVKLTSTLILPN